NRENFTIATHQGYKEFCTPPGSITYDIDLDLKDGFTDTINFTVSNVPTGATAVITPNSLNEDGTLTLTLNNIGSVAFGNYQMKVTATGTFQTVHLYPILNIKDPQLPAVVLKTPLDEAENQPIDMIFTWEDAVTAEEYDFQLSLKPNFTS